MYFHLVSRLRDQFASLIPARMFFAFIAITTLTFSTVQAQTTEETDTTTTVVIDPAIDSLNNKIDNLKTDFDLLKHVKFGGHILAHYQIAQSPGAKTSEGQDFLADVDKRFTLRETRLKTSYEAAFSKAVVEIDITERGAVSLKDAYIKITDPWTKAISLTAGSFYRPFGFEVSYSNSYREAIDRARMIQTIFPGDRDLGAMITFQPPKESRYNFLKIDAGMFNGTGTTAPDYDLQKDIIGNIHITKSFMDEIIKLNIGGSYYNGAMKTTGKFYHTGSKKDSIGKDVWDSAAVTASYPFLRKQYIGGDAQLTLDLPIGITILRGEYIMGTQPGTATSSATSSTLLPGNLYIRNFNGGIIYFVQNIMNTRHQFVMRYDWYDPNAVITGNEISNTTKVKTALNKLTTADIKYTNLGFGWNYKFDEHVRLTAYYAKVSNESNTLSGFTDAGGHAIDLKDDVFTLRVAYKF